MHDFLNYKEGKEESILDALSHHRIGFIGQTNARTRLEQFVADFNKNKKTTDLPQSILPLEAGIDNAIGILKSYYSHQSDSSPVFESMARFFNGAWDRKNIDVVALVVARNKDNASVEKLLIDLKWTLVVAQKEVNPEGALAKCIERIQFANNLSIINMVDLNKLIKNSVNDSENNNSI